MKLNLKWSAGLLTLLMIPVLFPGCAAVFTSTQKTTFTSGTPGASINVSGSISGGNYGDDVSYTKLGKDSGVATLSNYADFYIIKQKKKGYRTLTSTITREKFNSMKFVDIGLPLLSDIIAIGLISTPSTPTSTSTSTNTAPSTPGLPAFTIPLLYGIVGWSELAVGPWKVFNKRYALPPLTPYPTHKDGDRLVYVSKVSVDIDTNHITKNYYSNMADFKHKIAYLTVPEPERVTYKDIDVSDDLNKILADQKFIDTVAGRKLSLNDYNWLKLNCDITGLVWNHIGTVSCMDLTCTWKVVENMTDKVLYSKSVTSRSNWGLYVNGEDKDTLLIDGLIQGMTDVLNDISGNKVVLSSTGNSFNKVYGEWDTKQINTGNDYASVIAEDAKAVVTVQRGAGHGSGCMISPDGYIITNCHVTTDTIKTFTVIFQNGEKHVGKFVRANPIYDLALIKVDSIPQNTKPLQLGDSNECTIGTEVFAIGTPGDIELGQTLTKGIVSATRKFDNISYIQSDVSVSPGSSGGGMFTKDGKLVGIVNAKLKRDWVEGVGFAIPAKYIKQALKLKF